MKNKCLLLILMILLLTGCTVYNINEQTNDELVNIILMSTKSKTNTALEGYKLYIPEGVSIVGDFKNNNTLYSNGEKYYLYVDLISYYNKVENEYKINSEKKSIYSKILNYNNKNGYILITEYDDKYFLEVMYNYAKIEIITKDVKESLSNSLIILNSIEFNDKVIESLIGDNVLTYDEEQFKLLGPSTQTDNFLKYEEEFGTFEDIDNELPDEDKIDIKNDWGVKYGAIRKT